MDYSSWLSLLWSVPGGLACMFMARAFMHFQQRDVDSSLAEDELLAQRGEVLVALSDEDMGRVRLRIGQFNLERFALAEESGSRLDKGEPIEIVRIADDCVYVRRAR